MLSMNSDEKREIHLVDPDLEDSVVISLVFDVIINSELDIGVLPQSDVAVIDRLLNLFAFFDKYQMDRARKAALVWLTSPRSACLSALDRFTIGASQDDADVCLEALLNSKISLVRGCYPDAGERQRYDLDPRFMPSWDLSRIPSPYLWALLRAWDEAEKHPNHKSAKITPDHVHGYFKEYLAYFKICAIDEAAAAKRSAAMFPQVSGRR